MLLGKKIVQNLDNDKVEKMFLDTDFLNRTVLKIIIEHNIYSILSNHKIDELLDDMWHGKEYYKCNGRVSDYSRLQNQSTFPLFTVS